MPCHTGKETIGKHNKVPDSRFNKRQLKMGIKTETEHTSRKKVAKKIAKDHLSEISDYYTRLTKMERKASSRKK